MIVIYFISALMSSNKHKRQGKQMKKSSLVSVVNKSQYCDGHSEDTISNVQDTDYLFFVWSC